MFSSRSGFFETNSSSTHVFAIPKESIELHIPKSINFNKNYPEDSVEYRICILYDSMDFDDEGQNILINYLKSKGCEVIGYDDIEPELPGRGEFKSEEQLDKFLFGVGVVETYTSYEGSSYDSTNEVNDPEKYDKVSFHW